MEILKYISLDEYPENVFNLTVQLSNGGAGISLKRGDSVHSVKNQLLQLIQMLENYQGEIENLKLYSKSP